MRCLVVGGNGFIGSFVVDELVRLGHTVRVLDRFSDGRHRFHARGVEIFAGDFLNAGDVRAALQDQDVVYHLLSTTTPASAEADPLLDVRTNLTGSIELFRLAAAAGVRHIYFASTGGAIYGSQAERLIRETAAPVPVSPYAIGKLAIEGYLRYFRATRGLEYTVFRISNPFGPRQHPHRRQGVIPIFLRQIAKGSPITVYGDGSMVRDYMFVGDLAKLMVAPLEREPLHDTYNLGSGVPTSVNEIIATVTEITGRTVEVEHLATPPTFVDHVTLDVRRFADEFGTLDDPVSLRDGVKVTWDSISTSGSDE